MNKSSCPFPIPTKRSYINTCGQRYVGGRAAPIDIATAAHGGWCRMCGGPDSLLIGMADFWPLVSLVKAPQSFTWPLDSSFHIALLCPDWLLLAASLQLDASSTNTLGSLENFSTALFWDRVWLDINGHSGISIKYRKDLLKQQDCIHPSLLKAIDPFSLYMRTCDPLSRETWNESSQLTLL
ncbi:hypothetical protein UY3_08402 [Chelonia mydas]|uniref:Uncharacterized protein n=1 Tax=Chelonia mydas TaxID=8469 RepID=M7C1Z4_CHEMY|nr:hypothetical protein UY3_08402 [Chelonia mydas]